MTKKRQNKNKKNALDKTKVSTQLLDDLLIVHKRAIYAIDDEDKKIIKFIKKLTNTKDIKFPEIWQKRTELYLEYTKMLSDTTLDYLNYLKSQKADISAFSINTKKCQRDIEDIEEKIETNPQEASTQAETLFNKLADIVADIQIQNTELLEKGKINFIRWTYLPALTITSGAFVALVIFLKDTIAIDFFWTIILYLAMAYGTFNGLERYFFKNFEEEYESEFTEEDD